MSTEEDINSFFGSVADRRAEIDKLPDLFRRTLLLSLLDMLAKCAFPEVTGNRKRFVDVIDHYSAWKYKDYVSLTQLQYLLAEKHGVCLDLKTEVESRLNKRTRSGIRRSSEEDPQVSDLSRFAQSECSKLIKKARYASLLWDMRNFAIHEFRPPGKGWALSSDNSTPYYHGLLDMDSGVRSWELYVSPEVISTIVASCVDNLKEEFQQKKRNPYNSFAFGSSWFY